MDKPLTVQYALECLQAIDLKNPTPLTTHEIGKQQGIPIDICQKILDSLVHAGILEADECQRYRLRTDIEELTSLEILQAIWTPAPRVTSFRILFAKDSGALQTTLQAVTTAPEAGEGDR